MQYLERTPSKHFAASIKCFWQLEYPASSASNDEPILPDGCPELVFNLSNRFVRICGDSAGAQPATICAGQMTRNILLQPSGSVKLFGVRFNPAGAQILFPFSIHELTDRIIDFAAIAGRIGSEIEDRVSSARTFESRIAIVEGYLSSKVTGFSADDLLATKASGVIVAGGGQVPVSFVADSLGVSTRRLERTFRRSVGVSPKMLSRIVRFQTVVRTLRNCRHSDPLAQLLECGYYDQSHLIRDFREFGGTTPTAFLNRQHQISDAFTT